MKKNAAFALFSFAVLKWHEYLSFQPLFELTVEIPAQLHLELEVNLLVRNVIEREIEGEKAQMKPPTVLSHNSPSIYGTDLNLPDTNLLHQWKILRKPYWKWFDLRNN